MDLPNILNSKGAAAAATAVADRLQQHLAEATQRGRPMSDTSSERASSPRTSDRPSKYPSHPGQPLHTITNMAHAPPPPPPPPFAGSPHLQQPVSMMPTAFPAPSPGLENGYSGSHQADEHQMGTRSPAGSAATDALSQAKAFACGTCGKGFARRSDLARHERIHSGVRPHVCDYPGCGKMFIQRSALTVHARVHTGEKPHMCEHCTKPFSDSSSLARHRRIHSGKRPYKCPYADCQKTFTRRTTLTRHQNHHTGTVEESARATAAALAARPSTHPQRTQSDGGTHSGTASARTTPSPAQRTISISPASDMPQITMLSRQHSDFSYIHGSLPPHMRGDAPHHSPRSSPGSTSPSLPTFGSAHHRPSMTSHPSSYGPPPTLEPPTQHEQRTPGSSNGSPHMSHMGWQSPTQGNLIPSSNHDPYAYPEPAFSFPPQHLYYPSSNIRRPQSTEPDQYETKPRMMASEVWPGHM